MASNKNQHFVPRCYLKPFTLDGAGIAINLFNIDRCKSIPCTPVKNQCSRDYFYGKDLYLERALQLTEGIYAKQLSAIQQPNYLLNDEHRKFLLRFLLLQHLRTEAASKRSVEMFLGMENTLGESAPTESFKLSIREAVIMAMRAFVTNMHMLDDLKVCLIRNRTSVRFITSDDPAIITNRWHFEDDRAFGKSPGLSSSGLIAFLPLTPEILCIAYDGDVYSIPHSGGWVIVKNERDIYSFNLHQYLNCRANIYFQDWQDAKQVESKFDEAATLRLPVRYRINYAIFDGESDGHQVFKVVEKDKIPSHEKALIHTQVLYPVPNRWPSQIKYRRNGSIYTNGTGIGYVREGALGYTQSDNFRKVRLN